MIAYHPLAQLLRHMEKHWSKLNTQLSVHRSIRVSDGQEKLLAVTYRYGAGYSLFPVYSAEGEHFTGGIRNLSFPELTEKIDTMLRLRSI